MMSLERSCVNAAHWSEDQYQQAFDTSAERLLIVAEALPHSTEIANCDLGTGLLGFLVAQHVAGEWELENLVVALTMRRKGVGTHLLDALIAAARETSSRSVYLEVRESNTAARSFYERAGFEQTGRRKSYYNNPLEDAILYRRVLG